MDDTTATPSHLPWDTTSGNRFSQFSPKNHSAPLWIAAILGLIYTSGVLLLRAFIKRRVFGWDDYLIAASSLFATGQFIIIYVALRSGLGKKLVDVSDLSLLGDLAFSNRVLFVVSIYLAKLSVLFLLHRLLMRDDCGIKLAWFMSIGFTIVSGLISILVNTIECPSSRLFESHCSIQITRWSIIIALDVATELVTLLFPPYLVWQLQMKTGNKIRVIVAFSFRISVIVFSILQFFAWIEYTEGPASTFRIVPALVLQQVTLSLSLITATIPNMKAFLQSLAAGWGEPDFGYTRRTYGDGTFELKNLRSERSGSRVEGQPAIHDCQPNASAMLSGERTSLGSSGSQDLIIRKETTFAVERT